MITCKFTGQTGNNLFQAAATFALAKRNGVDALFPEYTQNKDLWKNYISFLPRYNGEPISVFYDEPDFTFKDIPFTDNMCLKGWFQSYRYFEDYLNEFRELLALPYSKIDAVSVHVRRGDYLKYPNKHPTVTVEYLRAAMEFFPGKRFVFFSDDPTWVDKHFPGVEMNNTRHPLQAIGEMSCYEHNIICNSTFSYWGAILNPNPEKMVVTVHEDNWFGLRNKHLNVKDLLPPTWIRIKFDTNGTR